MTALQIAMVLALAVGVAARRETRTWLGAALVAATSLGIIALEASGWPFRVWAEGLLLGVAAGIVVLQPQWLRLHREFADEYSAVDRIVWRELTKAEERWRAGSMTDAEYARVFDWANVRYRALRPPNAEWRGILAERVRIREEWSRIFANPAASSQLERDRLAEREQKLRKRIGRAT